MAAVEGFAGDGPPVQVQLASPFPPVVRELAEIPGRVARTFSQLQRSLPPKGELPGLPGALARKASSRFREAADPLHTDLQRRLTKHTAVWRRQQLGRSVEFWARAVGIYGGYKICQAKAGLSQDKDEQSAIWDSQHEEAADRLYGLCTDLGGFFLKAGQFFAKPDLAPDAWVRKLSRLHDGVPASPYHVIRRTIEEELGGRRFEDVFEWVEESPVGSASIAQVHKGKLKGSGKGEFVAVKVQRKDVEPLMLMDLANLKHFAAFLQAVELPFDLLSVVQELEEQIRLEFDFNLEADAMDRIGQSLRTGGRSRRALYSRSAAQQTPATPAHAQQQQLVPQKGQNGHKRDTAQSGQNGEKALSRKEERRAQNQGPDVSPIIVPRAVPGLVSRHLLVMQYVDGIQILRMPEEVKRRGLDPNGPLARRAKERILKDLIGAFGLMMLRDGEFQADPHPGNILVCSGPKVALLDYGQTKELTRCNRHALARLFLAAASADPVQIEESFKVAGIATSKTAAEDPHSFLRMGVIMWDTKSSPGLTSSNPFSSESTLKSNSVNTLPKDLFFALKVMQFLRGLSNGMGVNMSAAEMWSPLAREVLKEENA